MHAHPPMAAGLAALLRQEGWLVATDGDGCLADVVVADYDTGIGLACAMAAERCERKIVIVASHAREWEVWRALDAGVSAYLLEDTTAAQLGQAVRSSLAGSRYLCREAARYVSDAQPAERLTSRENDVLLLLARGYCNKLIARHLGIEVGTVKWHLRSLMGKLGASGRTQAVVVAVRRGIVGLDDVAA